MVIMINILKNNKVSATIEKQPDFQALLQQVCRLYSTTKDRVFLVWLEENNDKTFLERDLEYLAACETCTDLNIIAYIKAKEWTKTQIKVLIFFALVAVILLHVLLDLPVLFLAYILWNIVWAAFEMVYFIVWDIQSLLYWAPFAIPFVYYTYLCSHWGKHVLKVKSVSKTRLFFFGFFGSNLIPNAVGFLSSMIGILWMIFALLNILLHKARPLSSKDTNFLVILGMHLVSSIARVIYFY